MKSNAINLYKHFCKVAENPKGNDLKERNLVRGLALKNKANMEERFKTAKKYKDDPEIQALISPAKEKPKEETKQEVKSDGKKSKR